MSDEKSGPMEIALNLDFLIMAPATSVNALCELLVVASNRRSQQNPKFQGLIFAEFRFFIC